VTHPVTRARTFYSSWSVASILLPFPCFTRSAASGFVQTPDRIRSLEPVMPISIIEYRSIYQTEVVDLILEIQNVEFNLGISLDDQSDLLDIDAYYTGSGGGFWLAVDATGQVVGTIGLQLKSGIGIMKKFFVPKAYRGADTGCATMLFDTLLNHATSRGVATIVLDTPAAATRSHMFYQRHGFREIERHDLPITYDYPDRNSIFFRLDWKHQERIS
jgi:GNAT superfamily N-acetyltransferase